MADNISSLDKKWLRPSLLIFVKDNEPTLITDGPDAGKWNFYTSTVSNGKVLYLTDDGRDPLQVTPQRLEFKRRMIDGTMRSNYVADKNQFSTSWKDLPSRKSLTVDPYYKQDTNDTPTSNDAATKSASITSDGFGAGQDIKDWYESTPGDFWILAVYDGTTGGTIATSAEKYHVFFDAFNYSISRRGQYNDLWDVSITLVEA